MGNNRNRGGSADVLTLQRGDEMTGEEKRSLTFDFLHRMYGLDDALAWATNSDRYADDEVSDERVAELLECFKGDNDDKRLDCN